MLLKSAVILNGGMMTILTYRKQMHKKALARVARRLVHDTSHVTNLANILLEAQTNLSLISSRSDISFSLLYTSTVTDEIALLHFDNLATYFLFSQITDFEFIAQSTDFHFLNIYRFGVRRISFHFFFHFVSHVHCNCVLGLGSGTVVGALANLAGVRFPVSASHGGRLSFWFSPLLQRVGHGPKGIVVRCVSQSRALFQRGQEINMVAFEVSVCFIFDRFNVLPVHSES